MPEPNPKPAEAQETPDLASYLEERKRLLRAQFAARPLTAQEQQLAADMDWVAADPEIQIQYQGEFVVPWNRTIVAHGHDAAEVLAEAARLTGRCVQDLPLVGIVDPLLDIPH